jgi:transposase
VAKAGLAANKKGAAAGGSPIVFLDESGFMLQPVRRRTWSPSGQTPIQRAWDRHDRLSAIGFIGVSPTRRRLSLYFQLWPENVDTFHMIWLLRLMHRHYRRHVVLVWDRWNVHQSATAYFEENHPTWFTFEPLPSYSPELNPVEQCWNHTKYSDLPNFIPDDLDHLYKAVDAAITKQSTDQNLLRSFFAYADLPLQNRSLAM